MKLSIDGLSDLHGPVQTPYEVYGHLVATLDDLKSSLGSGNGSKEFSLLLLEIAGHACRALIELNLTKHLDEVF